MRPFKQLTAYVDLPCEWVSDVKYLGLTANKLAETATSLEHENVKLRELVRDLWPFAKAGWVHACPNRECCLFEECDADSEYECPIEEYMDGRMRDLGIEVD